MSFPMMADAFAGWGTSVVMKIVQTTISDFEPVETPVTDKCFKGVLQPVPPQKLWVKPEGQRNWKWYTMWTKQALEVGANVVDPDGLTYRVMSRSNWKNAGFSEYELTEGPTP